MNQAYVDRRSLVQKPPSVPLPRSSITAEIAIRLRMQQQGAGNYTGAGEKQINHERDVVEGCAGCPILLQKSPPCRKYAAGRGEKAAES
ncbi:unnamed protein product [Musa acuminata subsp. burmannicoides]